MVKMEGFKRALRAAIEGPSTKDVEWTSNGHDFNVKKIEVSKSNGILTINGGEGHHISHRLGFRPDDQVFYSCKVNQNGQVENLEINVKSSTDILKEWFETAGTIIGVIGAIVGAAKSDSIDDAEPTPSSIELLDGDWKSDAEFMIANIITYAAIKHMPELKQKPHPTPNFTESVLVVSPSILATFRAARGRLTEAEL
jgi:hypothetical protein